MFVLRPRLYQVCDVIRAVFGASCGSCWQKARIKAQRNSLVGLSSHGLKLSLRWVVAPVCKGTRPVRRGKAFWCVMYEAIKLHNRNRSRDVLIDLLQWHRRWYETPTKRLPGGPGSIAWGFTPFLSRRLHLPAPSISWASRHTPLSWDFCTISRQSRAKHPEVLL